MRARPALLRTTLAVLAAGTGACGPTGFDPSNLIESVRILATRSDRPYAKPGATVHSEVLAVDGRQDAGPTAEPMTVYWLPLVCINPPNDDFYACFSGFESQAARASQAGLGADGGGSATISFAISAWDGGVEAGVSPGLGAGLGGVTGGGSLKSIPAGVDLTPYVVVGPRATFGLPTDIISSHKAVKGAARPYGLAVVFNVACAGHLEIVPLDPSNPDPEQVPIGCFNAQRTQLTANDYVIGYTEIFSYADLSNQNPVISGLAFRDAGVPLDGAAEVGVSFPHCGLSDTSKCPTYDMVASVPDASFERDPQDTLPSDGGPLGEEVWIDYYTTLGSLNGSAILVFDPNNGRIKPPHPENIQAGSTAQHGSLWAVIHDNRGGASWITVALDAK